MTATHRCHICCIDFARAEDHATHREAVHHVRPKGEIRKAIDRLRREDRELLDRLRDT
jgi:hypothetical protein